MILRRLVITALLGMLAGPAVPASAADGASPSGPEACLVDGVNRRRAGGRLSWSASLQEALRRHARAMAADGTLSHQGMDDRVDDLPGGWTGYGETASVESLPSVDLKGVEEWCESSLDALWASDPHRQVLSDDGYEFVSAGAHWDGERIWIVTGVFAHPTYQPPDVAWPEYLEGIGGWRGRFADDDDSTFETDIESLAAAGVTSGCNPPQNTRFCPDQAVTRGEMAAFLVRAFGWEHRAGTDFGDDDSSVFEADIETLAARRVTEGCNPPSGDRFCPERPVTRAEMATFIGRALGLERSSDDHFSDVAASIHRGYINAMAGAGLTVGCDEGFYCPDRPVTRGEMAAFLVRAGLAG